MLYSVCGIHISYSVITAQLSPFKPTLSAHLATIHCRGRHMGPPLRKCYVNGVCMKYVLTVYILSCLYPHTFLLLIACFQHMFVTFVVRLDHQGG